MNYTLDGTVLSRRLTPSELFVKNDLQRTFDFIRNANLGISDCTISSKNIKLLGSAKVALFSYYQTSDKFADDFKEEMDLIADGIRSTYDKSISDIDTCSCSKK